ncbi:hypothetical protein Save01_03326 [Streptomyces avermitilis]|uniref:Lysine transporter LysE n=1 Tax=Streptomyces avermitilis TaxID=33903 RepID=A0A4D4MG91_STRAX|nr:hypothetical protein SAV14893_082950 [Streptomyces avermitilis]GDY70714.1 hypothetical protein SAV31267_001990 [Streptomyces avermitilis]
MTTPNQYEPATEDELAEGACGHRQRGPTTGRMLSTLLAFLGACTLIASSPGPSTMLIIRQSLRSRRAGFLTVLGNETGVFIWGAIAALGLTALLAASQLAYDTMRIAGAVTLVVFGIKTLLDARGEHGQAESQDARQRTQAGLRTVRACC